MNPTSVCDVLPWKPEGAEGFKVLSIEPEGALVLQSVWPRFEATWAFVLQPLPGGRTHLVVRYRAAYPTSVRMAVTLRLMAAIHAFMERKQLRTIKHHAERKPAPGIRSEVAHSEGPVAPTG